MLGFLESLPAGPLYALIGFLAAVENIFPPVPGEGLRFQLVVEPEALLAVAHVEDGKLHYDRVFKLDGPGDLPQSAR